MKKIFEDVSTLKKCLPNKTFTLVGGCFDLLHVGHVHLLEYASTLEDMLVVAVLSDANVREYKKLGRPIINQRQRAVMLASMRVVDFVYIADANPSGPETLQLLQPDSIVFGEGTSIEKVQRWTANVGKFSPHTKIKLLPRFDEEEISTSYIVKKIQDTAR